MAIRPVDHGIVSASGAGGAIVATGGTKTTSGAYTIHTFTGSGTFAVASGEGNVEVLVVAGGGSGGGWSSANWMIHGGGGGGGAQTATVAVVAGSYTVTVGAGGSSFNNSGANSVFHSTTSLGGGHGSVGRLPCWFWRSPARYNNVRIRFAGWFWRRRNSLWRRRRHTPNTDGGFRYRRPRLQRRCRVNFPSYSYGGGGGGGGGSQAGSAGLAPPSGTYAEGGDGGNGLNNSYSGSPVIYAGGGGGGANNNAKQGSGGTGGGGDGGTPYTGVQNGSANTGGGGGGASAPGSSYGTGGSGIVIARYLTAG